MNRVTITVSGPVGSGKSALCKEIEILCRALGVPCEWQGGREERNLSGGDSHDELKMYEPQVTLREEVFSIPLADAIAKELRYLLDTDSPDDGFSLTQRMAIAAVNIAAGYAAPTRVDVASGIDVANALANGDSK